MKAHKTLLGLAATFTLILTAGSPRPPDLNATKPAHPYDKSQGGIP